LPSQFLPASVKSLERVAEELARKWGMATAFRDRSGIGRNLAIEVLEYFDRIKFTRRVGDAHLIRGHLIRGQSPRGQPDSEPFETPWKCS